MEDFKPVTIVSRRYIGFVKTPIKLSFLVYAFKMSNGKEVEGVYNGNAIMNYNSIAVNGAEFVPIKA